MAPLPGSGRHPQGSTTLAYDATKKTLSVTTTASGLPAGTAHAEHVHFGTCDSQVAVKYPLEDLVASPTGTADVTTVIQNVDQAPPPSGWYINVHLGSMNQIQQNGQPTLYFSRSSAATWGNRQTEDREDPAADHAADADRTTPQ